MAEEFIVPDLVEKAPKELLKICYPSGCSVDLGNTLTPTQVKDVPEVDWEYDGCSFYTLCMMDPDVPSRENPKYREWHYWLVGNIPAGNMCKGQTLSEYIGAGPPKGTGLHRYIFLVYRQNRMIEFKETLLPNTTGERRANFSIRCFCQKYMIVEPVAGNYFMAEWDDYVDCLYKQLGA